MIIFRKGNIEELDTAFGMLKFAAEWLNNKNINYWQDWHNPSYDYRNWIEQGFINEEFYFVESDEKIIGMFRLQENDEMFWGIREDKSGYIHSFTTDRNLVGNGIGYQILSMIEADLKSQGYQYLRLDCSSNIKGLCNYYEKFGFICVGKKELFGDVLNLYEKSI